MLWLFFPFDSHPHLSLSDSISHFSFFPPLSFFHPLEAFEVSVRRVKLFFASRHSLTTCAFELRGNHNKSTITEGVIKTERLRGHFEVLIQGSE